MVGGHQYNMRLIPSSCDLDLTIVKKHLKLIELIPGSVSPFTFEVTKIGNNLYQINLILGKNILRLSKLDVKLSHLNGTIFIPKKIIPDPSLGELAESIPIVTTTVSGVIGASFIGTLALGATPSLWSIINFQQFVGYFIFLNIEYPYQVEIFLKMLQSSVWDNLPNPAASLMETLYENFLGNGVDSDLLPPKKFVKYEMTSFFIGNGGLINSFHKYFPKIIAFLSFVSWKN